MMRTERLVMREWQDSDRAPFAELNADPEVMEHFPERLTRDQSDAFADRIEADMAERGWGLWALEADGEFIGYTGLQPVSFEAHFTPCVEVGWRLAAGHWGQGYAAEGARAVLTFGFSTLDLSEIVSFTATANVRSRRVMEKLGMTHNPADDFDHPLLAPGHPLQRHVLYRLKKPNNVPVY